MANNKTYQLRINASNGMPVQIELWEGGRLVTQDVEIVADGDGNMQLRAVQMSPITGKPL